MKTIGILTYLKEYANLGTNMQSYCTLKAIQKAYPAARVELIDYSGWKHGMRPYLSHISPRSLLNDFVRFGKYNAFVRNELVLSANTLTSADVAKSIDFIKQQHYDAIYVGSDTVLELQRAGNDNLTAYWLDNTVDCKKFLIAASSHNVVYDTLSDVQRNLMRETVDDFSLLGVRDHATFRLLSHFTSAGDKRLQIVPDPTFTYEIDYSFAEQYLKRKNLVFEKPVVCLHLLRDTKWALELSNYFRKAGFIVASLRPAYYADIILTDLSPFEQLGIYRYFDLVITHRFHDSIFCFKNCTPVIGFPQHSTDITLFGESKNQTLFRSFNVEKPNWIDNKTTLTANLFIDIHRQAITQFKQNEDFIKTVLRKHTEEYESFVKKSVSICME